MRGLALLLVMPLCAAELQRFEFVEPHMGTLFRITMYSPDAKTARAASKAAFLRVQQLDGILSDYKPDSELMRLCREGWREPVHVSEDLFRVLDAAQKLAAETGGAFDVSLGPVIRLWRTARREGRVPAAEEIAAAKQRTGFAKISLDAARQTVFLQSADMLLDLGGIGKGYAADQALLALRRVGVARALVAASGDLAIGDPPPGRAGWKIRIEPGGLPRTLVLRNAGVSTSGDAEQFVEAGGKRYSHIVDPQSGVGLTSRVGVAVIAPNGLTSDGLATAVSVLDAARAALLVTSRPGVTAMIAVNGRLSILQGKRAIR